MLDVSAPVVILATPSNADAYEIRCSHESTHVTYDGWQSEWPFVSLLVVFNNVVPPELVTGRAFQYSSWLGMSRALPDPTIRSLMLVPDKEMHAIPNSLTPSVFGA